MKTETYACQCCERDVVRPVTKGQRPKWCPECRLKGARARRTCAHCGVEFIGSGKQFCSLSCRSQFHAPPPRPKVEKPKRDPRGELRRGYEDGDADLFFAALCSRADTTGDCWLWPSLRDGYPYFRLAGRDAALHRAVLEVKYGAPLGTQHAHHICANSACVNPDHLQPVTHRENVAEMLARQSYLARIEELEQALAVVAPNHPLLDTIAVA